MSQTWSGKGNERFLHSRTTTQELRFQHSTPHLVSLRTIGIKGRTERSARPDGRGTEIRGSRQQKSRALECLQDSKTGQKLKIKLSVTEVSRFVDKFDANGLPVFDVPNGISVAISSPESGKGQ